MATVTDNLEPLRAYGVSAAIAGEGIALMLKRENLNTQGRALGLNEEAVAEVFNACMARYHSGHIDTFDKVIEEASRTLTRRAYKQQT
jgi:hypothetical protein